MTAEARLFPSLSSVRTEHPTMTTPPAQGEDDSGDAYDRAVSSGDGVIEDNERRITMTYSYFPSPTDLYQSVSWRSPISLLLLPFVYIHFLLLGIPTDSNSTSTTMDADEWSSSRNDEKFRLDDLSVIAQELDSVKQSHILVRTKARSVRTRLELIHQRCLIRASTNTTGQKSISSIAHEQQQQQQGEQRVVEMARARLQRDADKKATTTTHNPFVNEVSQK